MKPTMSSFRSFVLSGNRASMKQDRQRRANMETDIETLKTKIKEASTLLRDAIQLMEEKPICREDYCQANRSISYLQITIGKLKATLARCRDIEIESQLVPWPWIVEAPQGRKMEDKREGRNARSVV